MSEWAELKKCCLGGATWLALSLSPLLAATTPWEQTYRDNDATGQHVLGLWKFDTDDGLDNTAVLPPGQLQGGKLDPNGKFRGALESFASNGKGDRSHGFVVPNHMRLNPTGAFSIEMWIKPKSELKEAKWSVLVDKKYVANEGYQLSVGAPDTKKLQRLTLDLGFGSDSHKFVSDAGDFPENEWMHIAATYDGKGKVRFYRNGQPFGVAEVAGRAAVAPSKLPLSIGDRLGSTFPGFPGYIDEVRLTEGTLEFNMVRLSLEWPRTTFVRFEVAPIWEIHIANGRAEPISNAKLSISLGNRIVSEQIINQLAGNATHTVETKFDTSLRPDRYVVNVTVASQSGDSVLGTEQATVVIVPRPLADRMPVVMWGIGGTQTVIDELPRLRQLGFTHCFGGDLDYADIQKSVSGAPKSLKGETVKMLDAALAADIRILSTVRPEPFEASLKEAIQVDRVGAPLKRKGLSPNSPKLLEWMGRTGTVAAESLAPHPAFAGLCVNSEVRDASDISFTTWDREAYRQEFQADIPEWANSKYGINYATLKEFPNDRVIDDKDPRFVFYRWWWSVGDGWNNANSAVSHGLHQSQRKDIWTFYDPAVRVPPIWGSGGDVDVLSHWTYTDPDPLKMALACEELKAMAGGRQPPARIMKMTQLFWYRSTAAPQPASNASTKDGTPSSPREGDIAANWTDTDPNMSFLSIHPMHLREALWSKIARPVEGIMFHGWSSLVPTDGTHPYKYTQPELQHEFRRLTSEVVEPLGPTLRKIPSSKSDVGFIESFTSSMFARRGTWGYGGGWQADLFLALQYAHLQMDVLYEQHILRDGLDGYKVLVMADCDVLPRTVVERIKTFQASGGLVIGDSRLCPAIKADITVPVTSRKKDAASDKAALVKIGHDVRQQLNGKYQRRVDTSNVNVIPHLRRSGTAEYVFLVNDAREAGTYVGQFGRVQELGLPSVTKVRLESKPKALYDVLEHRVVPVESDAKGVTFSTTLGPCDGKLFMALSAPVAKVSFKGPSEVTRSTKWKGQLSVDDASGKPIDGVLPFRIEWIDPDGRRGEPSGFYGVVNGRLPIEFDIASNDTAGVWELRAFDLASGTNDSTYVRVK